MDTFPQITTNDTHPVVAAGGDQHRTKGQEEMSEAPTHIYAYRDGYYPYWTTDPDLHRDAAQYIRADIAVGAAVAVKNHLAGDALQWTPIDDNCPLDGSPVLVGGYNADGLWRSYHGYYIQDRTVEANDGWDVYADEGWSVYDEATGVHYCPEGWYSLDWTNMDDSYQIVDHPITHYILIPPPPVVEKGQPE